MLTVSKRSKRVRRHPHPESQDEEGIDQEGGFAALVVLVFLMVACVEGGEGFV